MWPLAPSAMLFLLGGILLCGEMAEPAGGLLEVTIGAFTELKLDQASPTEILVRNIPQNFSFLLFQVHTQFQNVTLSLSKIPSKNDSDTGSDTGLVTILQPEQVVCTWYLESASPKQLVASAVTIPYTERDPIPGACNLEFSLDVYPNLHLQYNLYETVIEFAPANLGHARGQSAPACDVKTDLNSRWRLLYDVYQYFLPENNLNESTLLTHLRRMSMVQQVMANGMKLATLTSSDLPSVSFASIPGQGVIYSVIVRDPVLNTSAAYVPVHTYACNFTAAVDNCYTLGKVSTKIFFTFCGLIGLFLCFFGHRFLKTDFFFVGFVIAGFLMFVLLTRVTQLGYDARLGLTALSGVVGGFLLVASWWRCGSVYACVLPVGLVLGFLLASVVFFTPIGEYEVFRDSRVFWMTFSAITAGSVLLLPLPKILNILSCALVGSYTVVLAIDSYLYTSLSYITLNVLKRALNTEFSAAYTSVPFQTNDFIMIALWAVLLVAGAGTQFYRERERPPFPPTPYLVWKRDRERRKTNVLDPSYHLPPLKDRVLLRLAQFREIFRREQPAGERTPLLL
ncbi:transmembrane 7 superfamily member 3 [Spea bombifrons]|uniref:transmembrane 7 superfamily member 3 n=1 Tax=Spea bombifrons TaxID=233779 RepID=UPI0023490B5D|nr:transmembrane 7 superfamily member 3 [Spea bombifrons]